MMTWFNNLNFRFKLLLPIVLLALVLIAIATVSMMNFKSVAGSVDAISVAIKVARVAKGNI